VREGWESTNQRIRHEKAPLIAGLPRCVYSNK
jgi:hypothetical protein